MLRFSGLSRLNGFASKIVIAMFFYLHATQDQDLIQKLIQGEFEFGEDPPGERVFDIQIEELKAKAAFACSQDQNHAWLSWKTLIEACLVVNGARHFQISQTKISWLNAPLSLKSLYLDELIFF